MSLISYFDGFVYDIVAIWWILLLCVYIYKTIRRFHGSLYMTMIHYHHYMILDAYVCMDMWWYLYIYININVDTYIYTYMSVCVCACVCVCVCMWSICISLRVCVIYLFIFCLNRCIGMCHIYLYGCIHGERLDPCIYWLYVCVYVPECVCGCVYMVQPSNPPFYPHGHGPALRANTWSM